MKRSIVMTLLVLAFISCNDTVERPKNLIEKDKMINILYDVSLLESIKTQNINGGISNKAANEYIYKKYKVDSTQLAQSNKYYAADLDGYKKMFEEVKRRLEEQGKKAGVTNNPSTSDAPQIQ